MSDGLLIAIAMYFVIGVAVAIAKRDSVVFKSREWWVVSIATILTVMFWWVFALFQGKMTVSSK